jgi:hypothetical protein
MIMEWQKIAAKTPAQWEGNLNDDCTARWAGLTLRAEWMTGLDWWWCVYDDSTGDQIASSNESLDRPPSGDAARKAAEQAGQRWLGLSW